ncbi:group 1 glycosyl transferase [Oleiphilus messinensis]|uniref:Group 1 glycosyl transferase n=1 Tax=Oleiphilus messinensis TaxID=141451 RepID=A0A1Y0I3Z0_9GAMM|nr:glycosyltransferase family 4 protein [Oleiphilus messinensis]ARU55218.1 group 1 glycosyl transferase [Oleiphilus messinensis]
MTKKAVVLFLDSRGMGGIETHVRNLAAALCRNNFEVRVLLWRRYGKHPLEAELGGMGITLESCDGRIGKLLQQLKSGEHTPGAKTPVLHSHGYKANLIGRFLRLIRGIHVVSTYHNGDLGSGRLRLYTALDCMSGILSRNIAVSAEIQARIWGTKKHIPNFVTVPERSAWQGMKRSIGFVGRLEPVKRPDRFIQLARQLPNWTFHLFGDGGMRAELSAEAAPNVVFWGQVNAMDAHWQRLDLLVICSDAEGLPLAALESMSVGVPVVARPLGDLPVLIEHGVNGYLADSLADFESVIQQWQRLSLSAKTQISRRAISRVREHYSEQTCVEQISALYA